MIIPIIMAGGSGTRLWPLSRSLYPKQFLSLLNNETLFQNTLCRLADDDFGTPIIITNNEHRFLVSEQVKSTKFADSEIILEPCAKNTAPAIAVAAFRAIKDGSDPILLVMPADHLINNEKEFIRKVKIGSKYANQGYLVTFGINPTTPETGYGYIKSKSKIADGVYEIDSFVEKPSLERAREYISTGGYSWNSGIFIFKASSFLKELFRFRPKIYESCQSSVEKATFDLGFFRLDEEHFESCPSESIDFAVMELTDNAIVIPVDFGWNDIGSWSALWEVSSKLTDNNVAHGDVYLNGTTNSYIHARDKFIACVGLDNIIIVDTKDALLVVSKSEVQKVKDVVNFLTENNRCEYINHNIQFRPWGKHELISNDERFNIRRVIVKPGQSSAEQIHYNRAEHWIVISGTAKVKCGDVIKVIKENESTYIPVGIKHSFENPGKIDLEIIEVQTGPYLADDDIFRDK